MSRKDEKDVKCTLPKDTWKRLKILSVTKDVSVPELVKDILESYLSRKKVEGEEST